MTGKAVAVWTITALAVVFLGMTIYQNMRGLRSSEMPRASPILRASPSPKPRERFGQRLESTPPIMSKLEEESRLPEPQVLSPGRAIVYGQIISFRAPTGRRAGTLTLRTAGFNAPLFAERNLAIRVPRDVFDRISGALRLSIPRGRLVVVRVQYLPGAPYMTLRARGITALGPGFRGPELNETAGAEDFGPGSPAVVPLSGGS